LTGRDRVRQAGRQGRQLLGERKADMEVDRQAGRHASTKAGR